MNKNFTEELVSLLKNKAQCIWIKTYEETEVIKVIKSIINNLGTQKIPRLKIGIAHDRSVDTKDYVLDHFNKYDLKLFENKTQIFNNIINDFISQDINYCMANYNRR